MLFSVFEFKTMQLWLLLAYEKHKKDKDCAMYQWKIAWKHWNIKDFLFIKRKFHYSANMQDDRITKCDTETQI